MLFGCLQKLIGKGRWVLAHSTFSSLFANMKNKQQKPFIVYKQWLFPRTCHSSEIAFYSKRQRCILKDEVQLAGYDLYFVFVCLFCFLFLLLFFYCSGFYHTLKWNSHGFTCVPHPDPPSHLPLHPIPLGLPSSPGPSACLMHPTWAGDMICILYGCILGGVCVCIFS